MSELLMDQILDRQEENKELTERLCVAETELQSIAKVAHAGGIYGYGNMGDALTRIREITLPYWDKVTTI